MRISALILIIIFIGLSGCKSTGITAAKEAPKPVVVQPALPKPVVEEKPKEKPKEAKEIKIALMLPLYLEQNLKVDTNDMLSDVDPLSLPALSFYEGALLAVDSLRTTGIKAKLSVFDVSSDSSARRSILSKYQALKSCDMVFASFPSSQSPALADAAKQLGLKMILAQSVTSDFLKNNSNVALASPSTIMQCRLMTDYITRKYYESRFIVLTRNNKREAELAGIFKEETDKLLAFDFNIEAKSILLHYTDSGKTVIKKYFSPVKGNVIYLPSSDESYVSSVLAGLDTLNTKMTVVGLPTWENFESIQFSKMENIELYIFSSSCLDYNDTADKLFRKKFINAYKTDPLLSAYQGFDIIFYFSQLFNDYDKAFMDHLSDTRIRPVFNFVKEEKTSGYENAAISVLRYENYQLIRMNK